MPIGELSLVFVFLEDTVSDKPSYDPDWRKKKLLTEVAELVAALPKGAIELGKAIILPNSEAGYTQSMVTKKKR